MNNNKNKQKCKKHYKILLFLILLLLGIYVYIISTKIPKILKEIRQDLHQIDAISTEGKPSSIYDEKHKAIHSRDNIKLHQPISILGFQLTRINGSIDMSQFKAFDNMINRRVESLTDQGKTEYCLEYGSQDSNNCGQKSNIVSSNDQKQAYEPPKLKFMQTPKLHRDVNSNQIKNLEKIMPDINEIRSNISKNTTYTGDLNFNNPITLAYEVKTATKLSDLKHILLWNDFFGMKDWEIGLGNEPFYKHKCQYKNCFISNDRDLMNISDAILFHVNELKDDDKPKQRTRDQRWVFFNMESPRFQYWENAQYKHWDKLFNWTMTYKSTSDIQIKYGMVTKRPNQNQTGSNKLVDFSTKTKDIAWIVSNCQTPSKRWSLYKLLTKYIDIDVYGKCGQFKCERNNQCWREIGKKYKFYLSFENALCKDYITEKAFKPLEYGLVPIVYGLGNYSNDLPHGSYINVNDYDSMEHLANYLNVLSDNRNLYDEFFKWQKAYEILGYKESIGKTWCKLCQKLNEDTESKVYNNIAGWWNKKDCKKAKKILKKFRT